MKYILIGLLIASLAGCAGVAERRSEPTPVAQEVQSLSLLWGRAELAYKNRDLESAKRDFEKLAKLKPADDHAWFRLGNIAALVGEDGVAIQHYRTTLSLNPKHKKAHFNLASMHLAKSEKHFLAYIAITDESEANNELLELLAGIERFSTDSTDAVDGTALSDLAGRLARSGNWER